jgi:AraC family ethanolamine operon transcriptional activator
MRPVPVQPVARMAASAPQTSAEARVERTGRRRALLPGRTGFHSIESAPPGTWLRYPESAKRKVPVNPQLLVFQDFHIHGASAPEWSQRYLQMSPGVMRSTLHEWSTDRVHVFRKWMSERVVQQGSLPRGQVCFALLGSEAAAGMRVQGREFDAGHLLILRGGQEFEIQRPAGVELLSVTFSAEAFAEFLDASPARSEVRRVLAAAVIRPDGGHAPCASPSDSRAGRQRDRRRRPPTSCRPCGTCSQAQATSRGSERRALQRRRSSRECQHIALTEDREQPLRIEELCSRLRTSRRTLQNSFRQVTGASPVVYLRNLRLNAVRRRLMSTTVAELSVSRLPWMAASNTSATLREATRRCSAKHPRGVPRALRRRLLLQAPGLGSHTLENCGGHIFREARRQLLCDGFDGAFHLGKQLADDVLGVFAPAAPRGGRIEVASHDGRQT